MGHRTLTIRIPTRWLTTALAILLAAAVLGPAAALAAGGSFTDDDTSIFEADIEWLAGAGVTRGCNPPDNTLFCPEDDVTRGQMAAFMRRFAAFLGAEDGVVSNADHADSAATAGDADTLDGMDSEAFVHVADLELPTAAYVGGDDFIELTIDDTVVASVTISPPAPGMVIVNSTANAAEGTAGGLVRCEITTGTILQHQYQQWWESGGIGHGAQTQMSGTRGFTVSGEVPLTVNLVCDHVGSPSAGLHDPALTAIFVPSAIP